MCTCEQATKTTDFKRFQVKAGLVIHLMKQFKIKDQALVEALKTGWCYHCLVVILCVCFSSPSVLPIFFHRD
eukprot:m.17394 g.17394  ORF g.17394 m.17394 type:complete len:72 (-) comp7435_c1_seq1:150-365(-)